MHNPVFEEIYQGHRIKIHHDIDPQSPREWRTFGTIICWHRNYRLGDDHGFADARDFLVGLAGCSDETDLSNERLLELAQLKAVILPVYLYDHSGLAMNTVGFYCPWDSGQVGFVYARLEDVRKEFDVSRVTKRVRQRAEELLRAEIAIYHDYLNGNVYGFTVEQDGEEIDACWGFFGDYHGYCLKEARSAVPRPVPEPQRENSHA